MDYSEILTYAIDNGISVVLSSLFLFIIFKSANIAFKYFEDKYNDKKHTQKLDIRSNVSEEIQDLIDLFLVQSRGNRVMVIEFSNSDSSVAYLPFKFMTCTYEVCRQKLFPMAQKINRLTTSLFTTFFSSLNQNDYCIFDMKSKDVRMGGAMYDLMLEQKEKKSLCVMMYTLKGKALGYVTLKKDEDFTENDIKGIQLLAKQISALLSVTDK